jgi:hypothetical protein
MAKGNSGKFKQDMIVSQFQKIVRNERFATPTLIEKAMEKTREEKAKFIAKPTPPRVSYYNPNSPLNNWKKMSKEEKDAYNKAQRAVERAKRKEEKVVNNF